MQNTSLTEVSHGLGILRDSAMPGQRRRWKNLKTQLLNALKEEQAYWFDELPFVYRAHQKVIERMESELTAYQIYPKALSSTQPLIPTAQQVEQSTTHSSEPVQPSSEGLLHPNPSLPF